MYSLRQILILLFGVVISLQAVPPVLNYAGQVAVNGEAFDGNGLFKFALVNTDGNVTYWSNDGTSADGSEPQASVAVPVNGGLYSILLGNTAQQGMGAIDPAVFAQHTDAKLRVWFSDGVNGFQQLNPDRPFASVPYAFSAGTAQSATIADGSISKSMLGSDVIADLNKSVTITRDMLPQDVRDDLNKTVTITRNMLPADVLADLNKSSTTASPITLSMLAPEVTAKLDQNGSGGNTTVVNPPVVGSTLAVPHGSSAPTGYSMYHQVGQPKELVWEEKAPVSVARYAFDGVEVLDGKIYFTGGKDGSSAKNIAERYDPTTNTWETLVSMSVPRHGVACTVLNGKLYAIGGVGLSSVEIYDPTSESWSTGPALPSEVNHGTAITVNSKIYLVGGRNASEQSLNQVLCFDPSTIQWTNKVNMPTNRDGGRLVWFENRIWAIGGRDGGSINKVESYDPSSNIWQSEQSLTIASNWHVAWVANSKIYVCGGYNDSNRLNTVVVYNPTTKQWSNSGNLPENKYVADAVILNDQVYVIAGQTASGVYSNKVFAADLNASVAGIYDLYRKDGNASAGTPVVQAEVADGSVTTAKLNATILKYLKPEITGQPQAQTVYADTNATFSVTAEGKYLTYQWKKDGVSLTGETNATLTINDANTTQHDGNYSVVVSNDFGSVESDLTEVLVKDGILNGLVGWWKFDEGSGTVAYDSSGNGNDGNLTNGPTWVSGKIGGALSFDGVDDFVQTSVASNSLPISISTWIYAHDISGSHSIVDSDAQGQYGHSLIIGYSPKNGNYQIEFHDGSVDTSHPATLNQWTHAVVQFDSKISFFADGAVKLEQAYQKGNLNGTNFRMGRHGSNSSPHMFKGLIDDVRIYDRALSAAEVQALYNLGQ